MKGRNGDYSIIKIHNMGKVTYCYFNAQLWENILEEYA